MLPLGEARKEKTPMTISKTMEYPNLRNNLKDFILKTEYEQLWEVLALSKMVRLIFKHILLPANL
jgi:hypothetical protein